MLESCLLQLQENGVLYILMAIISIMGAFKCLSGMSPEPENCQEENNKKNTSADMFRNKLDEMFNEIHCYSMEQYR